MLFNILQLTAKLSCIKKTAAKYGLSNHTSKLMMDQGDSVLTGTAGQIIGEGIHSHFVLYGACAFRSDTFKTSQGFPDNGYDYGISTFPLLMDRKMASRTATPWRI